MFFGVYKKDKSEKQRYLYTGGINLMSPAAWIVPGLVVLMVLISILRMMITGS